MSNKKEDILDSYVGSIDLEKTTKKELVKVIKELYNSSRGNSYAAYKYQVEKINEYLSGTAIVDYELDDKDSKKFDRGKVLMDKLNDYIDREEKILETLVERCVDVERIKLKQKEEEEKKQYEIESGLEDDASDTSRSPHAL